MKATSWSLDMHRILNAALSLPASDLSALVGEILARAPSRVIEEARSQLEAN